MAASEPRVFVVEERPNPSTDYYLLPLLAGRRVVRRGFLEVPAASELAGSTVVFVRYLPAPWRAAVGRCRAQLAQVVLFIDDDVLDLSSTAGLPLRYRWKLAWQAARHKGWLKRHEVALWVSTPYLQRKYAAWSPRLIAPAPLAEVSDVRRVFYHGTAAHRAEMRWLRPVIEEVLRRDERVVFEIIGGFEVHRLYRRLPRVTVVHPMGWPAYRAFGMLEGRHIGLAPLLDSPFNRARACTKFFDITRCGAVGVYAASGPCAAVVRDGVDGLLAPMEPAAWVRAILALVGDEPRRKQLLENARARIFRIGGTTT